MEESPRICAGIVSYNPETSLLKENIERLLPQVNEIVIVDNNSRNINEIKQLIKDFPNISIIHNTENAGIAKALNQLCTIACQKTYEWILTMDQDSLCAPDMVEMLSAYCGNPTLGIIAPRVEFYDGEQLIFSTKDNDKEIVTVRACITSGSLTRISAWETVGGFNEWYFIDRVDNEFCTHLQVCNYKILRVNKALLSQKAGRMRHVKVPLLGEILLPYYNGFRNYHICRNTVYFLYQYRHNLHLTHEVGSFIYSQTIKLIFEGHKKETIISSYKGLRDGIKKIKESLAET